MDDPIRVKGPVPPRVLVVEDDPVIVSALRRYLTQEGFTVVHVGDGLEAVAFVLEADGGFDAILLDLLLPGLDGRDVCRRLRAAGHLTPIVMVTALGAIEDRVAGLRQGADDYLVKPFSLEELVLRLRIAIRGRRTGADVVVEAGDLRIDVLARKAWRGDDELDLTHREMELLTYFVQRPGLVLTRSSIASALWNEPSAVSKNLIDAHVARLRRKLDRTGAESHIETLYGVGFRLRATEHS